MHHCDECSFSSSYQTRISSIAACGIACCCSCCSCCLLWADAWVSTNFMFGDSFDSVFALVTMLFNWLAHSADGDDDVSFNSKWWCCCCCWAADNELVIVVTERIGGRGGILILFVLLFEFDVLQPLPVNVAWPFGSWWCCCCNLFCLASKSKLKNCLNKFG